MLDHRKIGIVSNIEHLDIMNQVSFRETIYTGR